MKRTLSSGEDGNHSPKRQRVSTLKKHQLKHKQPGALLPIENPQDPTVIDTQLDRALSIALHGAGFNAVKRDAFESLRGITHECESIPFQALIKDKAHINRHNTPHLAHPPIHDPQPPYASNPTRSRIRPWKGRRLARTSKTSPQAHHLPRRRATSSVPQGAINIHSHGLRLDGIRLRNQDFWQRHSGVSESSICAESLSKLPATPYVQSHARHDGTRGRRSSHTRTCNP